MKDVKSSFFKGILVGILLHAVFSFIIYSFKIEGVLSENSWAGLTARSIIGLIVLIVMIVSYLVIQYIRKKTGHNSIK